MKIYIERRYYRVRTVNIDLNKLQDEYFLGFTNEHLITTLNIKLTDDLILGDMFSLKFSVFGTRKIVSDLRAVDGVITYLLPQDITGIINRQCQVLI